MLIASDNHKSATAKGWNGKMAMLLRFAPFRGRLEVRLAPMKYQWRETAQTAKTSEGQRVCTVDFYIFYIFYTANTTQSDSAGNN